MFTPELTHVTLHIQQIRLEVSTKEVKWSHQRHTRDVMDEDGRPLVDSVRAEFSAINAFMWSDSFDTVTAMPRSIAAAQTAYKRLLKRI
jgi:hypothetical protein